MSDHFTSSPEPNSTPSPSYPPPGPGGAVVESNGEAERYVASQLQRERATLRVTRIVSVLVLLFVGIYLITITSRFKEYLEPNRAAEVADGIMMQQIADNGPEFVQQVKEQVPQYIEKTPDYVLAELPKYREQLADRVEEELTKYCKNTSSQLSSQLDNLLDQHKDHIKGMLESGNDPEQVKQVGEDMKQSLMQYIREKPASGEAIGTQIDEALKALTDVQQRVHKLALAKNLTPQEKKARRAIAILTQGIDDHKEIQLMK